MASVNSWIGAPIERREDLRFLRGAGTYVGDLKRENLLHAAVLRSSVAHGRIVSVDARPACALPGVVAVLTAADLPSPMPRIPMRAEPYPFGSAEHVNMELYLMRRARGMKVETPAVRP